MPPSENWVPRPLTRPKLSEAFPVPTWVTIKVMTLPVVARTLPDGRKQPISVPPGTGVGPSTVPSEKMPTHTGAVTVTLLVC